jgi:hypothetical protein
VEKWIKEIPSEFKSWKHLPYYLDEFTFCYNQRNEKGRDKLFGRLIKNAVALKQTTYRDIVGTHYQDEP